MTASVLLERRVSFEKWFSKSAVISDFVFLRLKYFPPVLHITITLMKECLNLRIIRPFIISYSFIIKATTINEMHGAVIIWFKYFWNMPVIDKAHFFLYNQAWILAPGFGKCPSSNYIQQKLLHNGHSFPAWS